MLPVIALVGRPNVGKSTLFNRLTRSRDALVADFPGLTRDRQYGFGKLGPVPYIVIDTGGLADAREGVDELMEQQTLKALEEADRVVFLVDAREGLTAVDEHVADLVRRRAVPVTIAVNKGEGLASDMAASEFHALGLGDPIVISAAHGDRVSAMMDSILAGFEPEIAPAETPADSVAVAVIGRPNVGKSTLINRLLGRSAWSPSTSRAPPGTVCACLSAAMAGTTRSSTPRASGAAPGCTSPSRSSALSRRCRPWKRRPWSSPWWTPGRASPSRTSP